jgi:hypothetical protein
MSKSQTAGGLSNRNPDCSRIHQSPKHGRRLFVVPPCTGMHYAELATLLPGYNECHDDDDDEEGDDDEDTDDTEDEGKKQEDAEWAPPAGAPALRIACNVHPPPEGSGRVVDVVMQRASVDFRVVRLISAGDPDKALLLSALRAVPAHIQWVEYFHGGRLTVPMDDPEIASALQGAHFRFRSCC